MKDYVQKVRYIVQAIQFKIDEKFNIAEFLKNSGEFELEFLYSYLDQGDVCRAWLLNGETFYLKEGDWLVRLSRNKYTVLCDDDFKILYEESK